MGQRLKNIIILLLSGLIFISSCGVNNRKKTEEVIVQFEQNSVTNKRETVFDVEASFRKGKVVLKNETNNANLKNELLNQR